MIVVQSSLILKLPAQPQRRNCVPDEGPAPPASYSLKQALNFGSVATKALCADRMRDQQEALQEAAAREGDEMHDLDLIQDMCARFFQKVVLRTKS